MHARHTRKKVRGLRRKCSAMIKGIEEYTKEFPQKNDRDYWHLHLPVAKAFIDSLKTPRSVRRLCIQTLIEQTNHLINIRQDKGTFTRIVAAIDLPELWDSQIIVFFSQDYYDSFFQRDSEEQRWTPLPSSSGFRAEWGLKIPQNLIVKGFKEEIKDEDYCHIGEIWFVGELINQQPDHV